MFVLFVYSVCVKTKSRREKEKKMKPDTATKLGSAGTASQPQAGISVAEPGHAAVEACDCPPDDYPPPEIVLESARGEPNVRLVADYAEAIEVLRDEKGFTFREIAEWLSRKFGIEADHNAVYRAYTKGMQDVEAGVAAHEDEEDERELSGGVA